MLSTAGNKKDKKMNILGLFPGQGSQVIGMGADFYNNSENAKEYFELADKVLGYSLSKLCLEGPIEELTLTQNAQPAILLISTISYQLSGIKLTTAAGHSLGEYSALVAAGAISFEDAILLVHKRGCYMQEAVPTGQGKMLAVMGPTEKEIQNIINSVTTGVIEIANLNSPGQTVVAGDVLGVDTFATAIQAKGAKVIPLNVSAPFHCRLMKPAAEKLSKDLDAITFNPLNFPIYANVSAEAVTDPEEAKELLKKQVCGSVRWTDCMLNSINDQGITTAVEFGAGSVLSKLLKRIKPEVKRQEVFDLKSLETLQDPASLQ